MNDDNVERAHMAGESERDCLLRERDELRTALELAVKSIRSWHGMGAGKHEAEMWELYWSNAPEMKPIRAILAKSKGEK